jgi:hypothetical protein
MIKKIERKRAIYKALIKEYGKDSAYDMYGEFLSIYQPKCLICGSYLREYSEWCDTGYEIVECLNGCYSNTTYGSTSRLETKNFYYRGELTEDVLIEFENQIKINRIKMKRLMSVYWNKKKAQRKRT